MAVSNSSISGLASGLDTASIIDQLMQLEAIPQTRLKSQQSAEKAVRAALQTLNTDVALLSSKAESLAKPETWTTLKGSSSATGISVAVGDDAAASSFSVTVDHVAVAHQFALTDSFALDDPADAVVAGGSNTQVRLSRPDGSFTDIDTGSGTLTDVVAGINATTADTKVSATAVRVADGSYRLLLQSTETGAASEFTLTNTDGTALAGGQDATTLRAGADAQIHVGGISATSTTNTFTDIVPGVSLTLSPGVAAATTSTVSVAQDPSGVTSAVKALVDQLNDALDSIDTQSKQGTPTTDGGPLAGDATARSLRSALANSIFGSGTTSMAKYGIQTDRYGKLVFDDAAFTEAFTADPAGTVAAFTAPVPAAGDSGDAGWAVRVAAVAKAASDSTNGTLTTAIQGRDTTIDRLGDSIDDWDGRLELRRESLTRQYTALETALSKLQSQGNWLAGQIASLPSYGS